MRKRVFKDKNYMWMFVNNKTLRFAIDPKKPIKELDFPEFYDIKITNRCFWNCKFCYQDSIDTPHYEDIVWKCKQFFGSMDSNQLPFQVALWGGNPNEHPDFVKLLEYLDSIGVVPNYTTNGMGITEEVIAATKKYCWGVALSCHKHLKDRWRASANRLMQAWVVVNFHHIIYNKESIDSFKEIYDSFPGIDYFVLLPMTAMWRQKESTKIEYEYLVDVLKDLDSSRIAFGANFYPYLKENNAFNISLYTPEILSKYVDLKWNWYMYTSSFSETPIRENMFITNG